MPTPTRGPRFGGSPAHERLILRNLAQSLFEHGKITTTEAKAKRLRPYAEKLITTAKRGDLHARREALKVIRDKDVVHKLFAEIGPSFATRDGGYTRIIKTAPRKGDNAQMAIIELIDEETVSAAANRTTRRAARTRSTGRSDATATAAAAPTETTETTADAGQVEATGADDEEAVEALTDILNEDDAVADAEDAFATDETEAVEGVPGEINDGKLAEAAADTAGQGTDKN